MTKISLRSYNRDIETLIEQGKIDLAIAHSLHILKYFPKHVDTYRLLVTFPRLLLLKWHM